MGRATSARRADPPYTKLYRGGGYTGRPKPSATARARDPDPRYNGGRCRAPFIGLHEKFRTHIPRCSVSFATAGSLSSDRAVSKAIGRARSPVRVRVFGRAPLVCEARGTRTYSYYTAYIWTAARRNSAPAILNEIRDHRAFASRNEELV